MVLSGPHSRPVRGRLTDDNEDEETMDKNKSAKPVWLHPEIPNMPAGEQLSAWLKAFNGGERPQIEEFQKHFTNPPPGQNVEDELGFRRMTGGFDLRKIEESMPTKVTGLVQERSSDQFVRFVMEVEPRPPHSITSWSLTAVATPAEFAVPRLADAQLVEAATTRIDELVKYDQFSGAVLVTKNGKPILSVAYGMADREKKIPNSLATKFRIGSMNKMFTATPPSCSSCKRVKSSRAILSASTSPTTPTRKRHRRSASNNC
jgi:hypothetical protein